MHDFKEQWLFETRRHRIQKDQLSWRKRKPRFVWIKHQNLRLSTQSGCYSGSKTAHVGCKNMGHRTSTL